MPIVTSPDGTRTVGLHAAALFPKDAPSLTTPPYTDAEFPLYLKPSSEAYADVIDAVRASLRQPATPLNTAFFTRANVDALQAALRERVAQGTGMQIDRQSDWALLLVMRRVYLDSATNWPESVADEVARLNGAVLQAAAATVTANAVQYLAYRSHVDLPAPLPAPADALTLPPFATGTPAPLRNLNAQYEQEHAAGLRTGAPSKAPLLAAWTPAKPRRP